MGRAEEKKTKTLNTNTKQQQQQKTIETDKKKDNFLAAVTVSTG